LWRGRLLAAAAARSNGGVNFALDYDPEGRFRFAALQSAVGRALLVRHGRRADDISSIVLVERDRCFLKSDAVLRISQGLQARAASRGKPAGVRS
jgi:predicted DCC family thiol-disulfide oxidoreductase YuxK